VERLHAGLTAERTLTVSEEHTAVQWGSGGVRVLSTPHMIALMEGAAVDAVDHLLPQGHQTVGALVNVEHRAATPVGARVRACAELREIDGRRLTFHVAAYDEAGLIGLGTHQRVVIDLERFMARANERLAGVPSKE